MRNLTCPKCGSRNVQTFEVIWRQSIRTNERGQKTVSEYGHNHRPPPQIGFGSLFVLLLLPASLALTGLVYLNNTNRLVPQFPVVEGTPLFILWLVFAVGLSGGGYIGIRLMQPRLKELQRVWKRSFSCRVCGERFKAEIG